MLSVRAPRTCRGAPACLGSSQSVSPSGACSHYSCPSMPCSRAQLLEAGSLWMPPLLTRVWLALAPTFCLSHFLLRGKPDWFPINPIPQRDWKKRESYRTSLGAIKKGRSSGEPGAGKREVEVKSKVQSVPSQLR